MQVTGAENLIQTVPISVYLHGRKYCSISFCKKFEIKINYLVFRSLPFKLIYDR